jgi:DNA-binding transcriptional ArsR family regulator
VLVERGEATPTALAEVLPFTRQAVSKHLAVLLDAGLVTQRREGQRGPLRRRPDQLEAAARERVETANRWNTRLQAIKRVAEGLVETSDTAGQ